MSAQRHHVVIGSGVAGNQAAETLRARDPDSRITMITNSRLPFFNRYDLPRVFRGERDWWNFILYPADYYRNNHITLRRVTRVVAVDSVGRTLTLEHKEALGYDTLLVATGAEAHMPEELAEFYPFMHGFGGFRDAIEVAEDLPAEGHAILLGGDIIGLDLARTLLDTGHKVTLIAGEQTFWPHEVSMSRRPAFIAALTRMGIRIIEGLERGGISAIEQGAVGFSPRRVLFRDGSSLHSDVIMPFFGITPALGFMLGSGADIERGLLVSPELRTSNENIWAAGDVCQIWTPAEKRYAFYYGWKNVRAMGELAAKNMTGASESWAPDQDESLILTEDGHIQSPFWEYR